VFRENGFDIAILNPPYVRDQGRDETQATDLMAHCGFNDDLYNHFAHRTFELLKPGGIAVLITSDTYFTLTTKQNMRHLVQNMRLLALVPTMKVFRQTVKTAILAALNEDASKGNYETLFIQARQAEESAFASITPLVATNERTALSFDGNSYEVSYSPLASDPNIIVYRVPIEVYQRTIKNSFFEPNELNAQLYNRFMPR
jgi:hypothetical protein